MIPAHADPGNSRGSGRYYEKTSDLERSEKILTSKWIISSEYRAVCVSTGCTYVRTPAHMYCSCRDIYIYIYIRSGSRAGRVKRRYCIHTHVHKHCAYGHIHRQTDRHTHTHTHIHSHTRVPPNNNNAPPSYTHTESRTHTVYLVKPGDIQCYIQTIQMTSVSYLGCSDYESPDEVQMSTYLDPDINQEYYDNDRIQTHITLGH